jgi:predicted ATP-dependent endonuclease of OLD family
MKLNSFQIKNYKVIDDTKPVKADPRGIALVGKNESGKSSVLKSLWKTRNVAGAKFDKLYDYPRDTYSRDRKGTQEVTILRFELSPTEIDEIVSQLPHPPSVSPKIATYITCSDPKIRTQTALFEWSGLDPQEILELGRPRAQGEADDQVHRRYEKRRALLDSASFGLTGDWIRWWGEKRHKLHFDVDGEDLVLKVSDEHNEFPIPFEERSHGFQWFFSFYLVFLVESKKPHKDAILLLDEPGLHLHPTLQSTLIELFERISETNQLIYSTHLPFLVDGNHFERVRTVYLTGPEPQKAIVSNDVRPTGDRDTLFPLQTALGYSIAQTLFLGKRSVIVEGITDFWIIKALDNCLSTSSCGASLHEDTILIPVGGTSRLMPLASIMLASTGVGERRLIVLLDSDKEGREPPAGSRTCSGTPRRF